MVGGKGRQTCAAKADIPKAGGHFCSNLEEREKAQPKRREKPMPEEENGRENGDSGVMVRRAGQAENLWSVASGWWHCMPERRQLTDCPSPVKTAMA